MRTKKDTPERTESAGPAVATACLILVHGTGASVEGPPGEEKWWQPQSAFVQALLKKIEARGAGKFGPEAFKWSGANSERARREAGRALAQRLLALERAGTPYHLIGHSHGGSVIWHALNDVTRRQPGPERLMSWTTVGTPFLGFAPRSRWYLICAGLSLLAGFVALLFLANVLPDLMNHGHFNPGASAAIGLGLVVIAGLAALAGLDVLMQIRLRLASKASHLSKASLARLSQTWLGIAHDLDEPINGLAATLSSPPQIAPRSWRPSPENRAQEESRAARMWRRIFSPYDWIAAPLIDSFVWDTGIARLQGRDIKGVIMTACRIRPPFFAIAWPSLPDRLREALARKADAAASLSAAAFRTELRMVGSGGASADRIARAISWNEVIHTTYFTNAEIGEICAGFIGKHIVDHGSRHSKSEAVQWIAAGPVTSAAQSNRPFEPRALYLARATAILGLVGLLGFAISAAHRAWVLPYTNRFQIELIAENIAKPQFTRLWESSTVGKVLIRLVALKANDQVFASLANIRNPNTRIMAAEQAAYAMAYFGDEAALTRVIADYAKDESGTTNANPTIVIKTYALAGALAGQTPLKDGLVADIRAALAEPDGASAYGASGPIELAATLMLATGTPSDVDRLLGWMVLNCDSTLTWLKEHNYTPSDGTVREEVSKCDAARPKPEPAAQDNASPPPDSNAGIPEDQPDRFATSQKIRQLIEQKDYGAVAALVLSFDDRFGEDVVNVYWFTPDWKELCALLRSAGFSDAAVRGEDFLEAHLRERFESSFSTSEIMQQAQNYADTMIELGRGEKLRAHAARLDEEAAKGPVFDSQLSANAGLFWLALGDIPRWKTSFSKAIEQDRGMGESGFPFTMKLAEIASSIDRGITLAALYRAAEAIEDAFAIDSVPNYAYSLTDISRLYAQLGEYRLARDVAEQVGQRLAENPSGPPPSDENSPGDPALEKDGLRGDGVLGGYVEILDAEISQSSPEGKKLLDLKEQWPKPASIYLTSFNRG